MRAIETRYAGHRFRSRLEARWAIVFDQLGITWRYEPEGFSLSDGLAYLPDFVLPSDGWTVEVKGDDSALDRDMDRIARYVTDSGRRVLVLGDVPDLADGRAEHLAVIRTPEGPRETAAYFMGWPVHPDDLDAQGYAVIPGPATLPPPGGTTAWINPDSSRRAYPPVVEAFAYARAARFEFGETPRRDRVGAPFLMAVSEASGMEGLLESVEGIWTKRWLDVEKAEPVDNRSRFQHPGREYAPPPCGLEGNRRLARDRLRPERRRARRNTLSNMGGVGRPPHRLGRHLAALHRPLSGRGRGPRSAHGGLLKSGRRSAGERSLRLRTRRRESG
jgi:hypothetical protein